MFRFYRAAELMTLNHSSLIRSTHCSCDLPNCWTDCFSTRLQKNTTIYTKRYECQEPPPPLRRRDWKDGPRVCRRESVDCATSCRLSRRLVRRPCISLGRAKADSPSPGDGPKHPIPQVGSGALPRKLQTRSGKWEDGVNMTGASINAPTGPFFGCGIEIEVANGNRNPPKPLIGTRRTAGCGSVLATEIPIHLPFCGKESRSGFKSKASFSSRTIRILRYELKNS